MAKSKARPAAASRRGRAEPPRADRRIIVGFMAVIAVVLAIAAAMALTSSPGQRPVASDTAANPPLTVTVAEAAKMRSEGAFVLDVRQPEEWAVVHVPGSTLIPLGELAARVAEVPRDKPVVVVCHSGNRSAQGRDILKAAGYTNVTSLAGGLTEWQAAGQPTVSGP